MHIYFLLSNYYIIYYGTIKDIHNSTILFILLLDIVYDILLVFNYILYKT